MLGLGIGVEMVDRTGQEYSAPTYSLSLDGTGDWVDFTETAIPTELTGEDLSISFWCKRTDNNDEAVILGNSNTRWWNNLLFDIDGNVLRIESETDGEYAYASVTQDTNWHHYVVTALGVGAGSGGESTVKFYEDGSDITGTGDNQNFGNAVDESDFIIDRIGSNTGGGGGNTAADGEFKGLIYQLAIYDSVLSATEAAAIYNSGTPIPLQSDSGNYVSSHQLTHLWRFNENTGSTTVDSKGTLTGTFAGNAAFSSTTP